MAPTSTALRRTLLILLVAAGIGATTSWWRSRTAATTPADPPQWPQWPSTPQAPEQPSSPVAPVTEQAWLPALDGGTTPESHPIKVKLSSGIFHEPGGRFYERTKADRCYPTAAAAEADGYRRSKT